MADERPETRRIGENGDRDYGHIFSESMFPSIIGIWGPEKTETEEVRDDRRCSLKAAQGKYWCFNVTVVLAIIVVSTLRSKDLMSTYRVCIVPLQPSGHAVGTDRMLWDCTVGGFLSLLFQLRGMLCLTLLCRSCIRLALLMTGIMCVAGGDFESGNGSKEGPCAWGRMMQNVGNEGG